MSKTSEEWCFLYWSWSGISAHIGHTLLFTWRNSPFVLYLPGTGLFFLRNLCKCTTYPAHAFLFILSLDFTVGFMYLSFNKMPTDSYASLSIYILFLIKKEKKVMHYYLYGVDSVCCLASLVFEKKYEKIICWWSFLFSYNTFNKGCLLNILRTSSMKLRNLFEFQLPNKL